MRSLRLQNLFGQLSARSQRSRQRTKLQWRPQVETMEGRMLMSTLYYNANNGVLTYAASATDPAIDLTISAGSSVTQSGVPNTIYLFTESGPGVSISPATNPVISVSSQAAQAQQDGSPITAIDVVLNNNGGAVTVDQNMTSPNTNVDVPMVVTGQFTGQGAKAVLNVIDTGRLLSSGNDISSTSIAQFFETGAGVYTPIIAHTNITYSGMSSVTVNDSTGADFYVVSTAEYTPLTLIGAGLSGVDNFTVGNDYGYYGGNNPTNFYRSTLDGIRASVTIDGGPYDTLTIDDRESTAATNTYTLDSNMLGSNTLKRLDYPAPATAEIDYKGMKSVEVDGGSVNDVFYVQHIETPTKLVGGIGGAQFGMNDDTGRSLLTLVGKSGHDWLNYNSYTGPSGDAVYVNLNPATLFATGTTSISGINNVLGSPGTGGDVLEGGPGNNILVADGTGTGFINQVYGGSGNDVLIAATGGTGTDYLQAGAGYDLMIGGTTIYDLNVTHLSAIMDDWAQVNSPSRFNDFYSSYYPPSGTGLYGTGVGFFKGHSTYALDLTTVLPHSGTNYIRLVNPQTNQPYGQGDWVFSKDYLTTSQLPPYDVIYGNPNLLPNIWTKI